MHHSPQPWICQAGKQPLKGAQWLRPKEQNPRYVQHLMSSCTSYPEIGISCATLRDPQGSPATQKRNPETEKNVRMEKFNFHGINASKTMIAQFNYNSLNYLIKIYWLG